MVLTVEQRCKLWLSAAGVSADRFKGLISRFGSAQAIWEAFGTGTSIGVSAAQYERMAEMRKGNALALYQERMGKLGVSLLFEESEAYPVFLREIDDPPYVLYCMGDIAALQRPMIGVVGTRTPSSYGKEMSRKIAKGLAEAGICVVSGLAYGIDGAAHEGALAGKGATVAVLGSGINVPYPKAHTALFGKVAEQGGLVISEYALDASPFPGHFPYRNRIISGLSQALVFVEGKVKSGGMITVSTALAQGREVFAVPGTVGTLGAEGPHTILREGARLVTGAEDILEDLGMAQKQPGVMMTLQEEDNLSPEGKMILMALSKEAMTVDELGMATGIKTDALILELSVMEIIGKIRKDAGNLFSLGI